MKSRIWMMSVWACVLAGALPGWAATYYIDDGSNDGDIYTLGATGNDDHLGTTTNTPKATLGNLIGTTTLVPGDIIYIDTGTYAPAVISNTVVGASGTNIIFQGAPITNWASGGTVFSGAGYMLSVRSRHVLFRDIKTANGTWGSELGSSANNTFESVLASGAQHGMRNSGAAQSNRFQNCVFMAQGASAINIQSGNNN